VGEVEAINEVAEFNLIGCDCLNCHTFKSHCRSFLGSAWECRLDVLHRVVWEGAIMTRSVWVCVYHTECGDEDSRAYN
jgi:hypothetical protein